MMENVVVLTPQQEKLRRMAKRAVKIAERAERFYVTKPEDVHAYLLGQSILEEQECLWVLALDARNQIVAKECVYRGSVNTSLVRLGEIFRMPIIMQASAVIVVHNHPSGDPSPSPEDVALTVAIVAAGKLLDIAVLDHVVIGARGYVSLKSRGLGF
jgi:DNA repair protein RadC